MTDPGDILIYKREVNKNRKIEDPEAEKKAAKKAAADLLRLFKTEKRKVLNDEINELMQYDAWNTQSHKEAFEHSLSSIKSAHGNNDHYFKTSAGSVISDRQVLQSQAILQKYTEME